MNTKMVCVLPCKSEDDLRQVFRLAKAKCDLDGIYTMELIAYPKGVEYREIHKHEMNELFEGINVSIDSELQPNTVRLEFRPAPGAKRAWKDAMNQIVRSLEKSGYVRVEGVSVFAC